MGYTRIVPSSPELWRVLPSHWPDLLSYCWPVGAIVGPGGHCITITNATISLTISLITTTTIFTTTVTITIHLLTLCVEGNDLAVAWLCGRALVDGAAAVHAGLAGVRLRGADQQPGGAGGGGAGAAGIAGTSVSTRPPCRYGGMAYWRMPGGPSGIKDSVFRLYLCEHIKVLAWQARARGHWCVGMRTKSFHMGLCIATGLFHHVEVLKTTKVLPRQFKRGRRPDDQLLGISVLWRVYQSDKPFHHLTGFQKGVLMTVNSKDN